MTSAQTVHETAITKLKTSENNNTVILKQPEDPDNTPTEQSQIMKDNFKISPGYSFIGNDQTQYEMTHIKTNSYDDDFYYRSSPNSQNDSDTENRLKIDLSEDEEYPNKRKSSEPEDYPYTTKYPKNDSPDEALRSPTFQDNFINSMRISNSSLDDQRIINNCDAEEISWHPHVYAKPPKAPTPHAIGDILGWSVKKKVHAPSAVRPKDVECQTNNGSSTKQLINVRRKDCSGHSNKSRVDFVIVNQNNSFAKDQVLSRQSPSSALNFVSCPPLGNLHAGGLVAAREGSVPGADVCEQPLDLCVARRGSCASLPSPVAGSLPQDLSKTAKKGECLLYYIIELHMYAIHGPRLKFNGRGILKPKLLTSSV